MSGDSEVPPSTDASDLISDDDVTVLGSPTALEAEDFPQGLSPRELSLTLKGQLLGHFHLQEFIGGGGMGAVFKALDTTLDRIVAVKVVASQSISSEELQRRFLVEAQSTARLDHPNIARIHFVGRDRGLPYIVFEYIEGTNLRDLVLQHGHLPVADALNFTCQVAHALAHAWDKEVVHRDIKPSNILITPEGQVKIVDMGLARVYQMEAGEPELTNTGVTLGTFDYISPEQARDPRLADIRSDLYSLGCTLFYMLVGKPPFAEGTGVQKLLQHQEQKPPSLTQLRGDIPSSVSQLVDRLLAKKPEARPQSPLEVVSQLYAIFRELGLQPPTALAPLPVVALPKEPWNWQRQVPWAVPLALLLLVSALLLLRSEAESPEFIFPPLRKPAIVTEPKGTTEVSSQADKVSGSSREPDWMASPSTLPAAAPTDAGVGRQLRGNTASTEPGSILEFPKNDPLPAESDTEFDAIEFSLAPLND